MPSLSIIVPALNEAANLPQLVRRTDAALRSAGVSYEMIVVDDGSTDDTERVIAELGGEFPVRLVQRGRGAEGGLSGAVLAGFAQAQGEVLAVMDADLQHPPEALPRLLEPFPSRVSGTGAQQSGLPPDESGSGLLQHAPERREPHGDARESRPEAPPGNFAARESTVESRGETVEMVVGSRYVSGGSVAEKWGGFRKLNSLVATWLARPFAGSVRDPMSGFFALPRRVLERGRHLSPLGYKILLELMCKCAPARVVEVPIHFGQRYAGRSKLTLKEQFRYLEHLSRLYDYKFPRASPIVKFAIVVVFAWLTGAVAFVATRASMGAVVAVAIAYAVAIAVATLFHLRYVHTQRKFLVRPTPWRDFFVSALAEWITAVAVVSYLASRATGAASWELFVIPFASATVVRYILRKELLLDVRGLRPEERLARMLDNASQADAQRNEEATDRERRRRE